MRVLFYVEPFPVRNSMTHFADVARRAVALCARNVGFDLRIYANSETLRTLEQEARRGFIDAERSSDEGAEQERGACASEIAANRFLWPTESEDLFFNSQLVPWEADGLALWADCMRGGPSSSSHSAVLERLWSEFPFDVVLHWGENGAISRFSRDYGVTHIGLELGCSRKPFFDSYIFDPMGTNGAAVVPKLSIDQIERIVDGVATSGEESLLGSCEDAGRAVYHERFSMLPSRLAELLMQGGRKVAFLALQLFDDANLILFSKYGDLREVVLDVVPQLVEAGYLVVIKPHPASRFRDGSSQETAIARSALSGLGSHVVWLDDFQTGVPNSRLMQVADLVITVNSSVGFEALYFDKLVVVLGDAVYKPTGVFPTLSEAISGKFDLDQYLRKIALLRTFFLDAYLADERWLVDPQLFAYRVSTIASIERRYRGDAFAMASAMYAAFAPSNSFLNARSVAVGSIDSRVAGFVAPPPGGGSRVDGRKVFGFRQGANFHPLLSALKRASAAEDASGVKAWLERQWQRNDARLEVLRMLGSVDTAWYNKQYPDVKKAGISPIKHFSNIDEQWRIPSPMIEEGEYGTLPFPRYLNALFSILDATNLSSIASDSQITEEESDALLNANNELALLLEKKPRPFAVVAHLYYADLVDPLLDRLSHIRDGHDIIFTLPLWGNREIIQRVKRRFPDAICLPLPNRGRDVGPFLHVLPTLVRRNYHAVLKVQTKKGFYLAARLKPLLGSAWREYSWNCMTGSEQVVSRILRAFERDDALSMVGPSKLLLRTQMYPEAIDSDTQRAVGVSQFGEDDTFFAGTMFWMRPAAFTAMTSDRFRIENFSPDPENSHGELEHIIERLFGHFARKDGARMAGSEFNPRTGEARFDRPVRPNLTPLPELMKKLIEALGVEA